MAASWIIDLYTVSSDYPYSQEAISGFTSTLSRRESAWQLPDSFNYIRNSVKATVDAYDGTLTFYVIDETDSLINAYRQIYPEVFAGASRYPRSCAATSVTPRTCSGCRAGRGCGTTSPTFPRSISARTPGRYLPTQRPTPRWPRCCARPASRGWPAGADRRHAPLLPAHRDTGDDSASFVLQQPFTPQGRQNLTALLVARSDPEGYES